MNNDIGLTIGTGIILLFGLLIAVVLPVIIQRQSSDADLPFERSKAVTWMQILGGILIIVSFIKLAVLWLM